MADKNADDFAKTIGDLVRMLIPHASEEDQFAMQAKFAACGQSILLQVIEYLGRFEQKNSEH